MVDTIYLGWPSLRRFRKPSRVSGVNLGQFMSSAVHNLTEKEKQALRLLVNGYDAKSMAQQLGLSVHTVNERLREARRKMAVSSSREAARKLKAIEGIAPEFLGPKSLGEASTPAVMAAAGLPAWGREAPRSIGWIAGAMLMTISLALIAFAALSGTAGQPAAAPAPATSTVAETEAVRAARAWLALVDAGEWQRSWDATSQTFQSLNTRERWANVAASVQTPLGPIIVHELVSEDFVPAPPTGYQLVRFRSRYANRAEVILTMTLQQENERWTVSGIMLD